MIEKIKQWKIPFPYLIDKNQNTAKIYQAECTPDIYLLNKNHALVYHGRLDDNWKNPDQVNQEELKTAIFQLANNQPLSEKQIPSMGCSIKWQT
jgi:hypothetical protein